MTSLRKTIVPTMMAMMVMVTMAIRLVMVADVVQKMARIATANQEARPMARTSIAVATLVHTAVAIRATATVIMITRMARKAAVTTMARMARKVVVTTTARMARKAAAATMIETFLGGV